MNETREAEEGARSGIARRLRWQAMWCGRLRSPLYQVLLEEAANDVEQGGPVWGVLEGHEQDPAGSMIALRMMGAVHRLVLEGRAPALARLFPSAGGTLDFDRTWAVFRDTVLERPDDLRELVKRPVQTNEPGRSAALLGGFLLVAAETGLPLRLLEVGASAGLNLRWDRYSYSAGDSVWGERDSPVRFVDPFSEGRPPLHVHASVTEREGCDASPLDPSSEADRLTLTSYVWADQMERLTLLRAALEVAARTPALVEQADAASWLGSRLAKPRHGTATVVFHSIVMQYLDDEARARVLAAMSEAGQRATSSAPVAWLWMERGGDEADVRLTVWPGGTERLIARAGYHGPPIRWLERRP
jgi:hypothetical protein